jgi:hypothetical protein
MYKGGIDIIPWPMFHDASWFKSLSVINKKLDKLEIAYENARDFLQSTKVIMAKLMVCKNTFNDEILFPLINFLYYFKT